MPSRSMCPAKFRILWSNLGTFFLIFYCCIINHPKTQWCETPQFCKSGIWTELCGGSYTAFVSTPCRLGPQLGGLNGWRMVGLLRAICLEICSGSCLGSLVLLQVISSGPEMFFTHKTGAWPGLAGRAGKKPGIFLSPQPLHEASLGFLTAWWSQGSWISYMVSPRMSFPRGQTEAGRFLMTQPWKSQKINSTTFYSSSKFLKPAHIQKERNYTPPLNGRNSKNSDHL